jgi:hypothetical protein
MCLDRLSKSFRIRSLNKLLFSHRYDPQSSKEGKLKQTMFFKSHLNSLAFSRQSLISCSFEAGNMY